MQGILIEFLLFMIVQALFINGVHECFSGRCWNDIKDGFKCEGQIFYKINPKWFEKVKGKTWVQPLWGCVRCMSSAWSIITFWPVVIYLYGWHWEEIFVWIVDMGCLIWLNFFLYKKQ